MDISQPQSQRNTLCRSGEVGEDRPSIGLVFSQSYPLPADKNGDLCKSYPFIVLNLKLRMNCTYMR